ncbi:hypothetical protein GF377_11130 [candidate division GN15 bacterium]|nr:hypothetical protein [candidate division GN15 bacterium]
MTDPESTDYRQPDEGSGQLPETDNRCINCGGELTAAGGVTVCRECNSQYLRESQVFANLPDDSAEHVFIECPGATLYEDGTNNVAAGVEFNDLDDPSKGFRIVDHAVYAPTHTRWRRIKRDAVGKIRRCQGCQDYTIRMRRREGPDFFIPSRKHPNRKKLKSVKYRTFA